MHNVADQPDQTLLSPEPSVITGALLVAYSAGLTRVAGIGLLFWATPIFVGGALSVLPVPVLPFEPSRPYATTHSTCCMPPPGSR